MKNVGVWKCGNGSIEILTVARDEGEAINNAIEKEPILAAIGCHAELFGPVDGFQVVALVDDKYVFGDERRDKEEKARKEAEAKHEKQIKATEEAEAKKLRDAQAKADKEAEKEETKRKAEELKAIDDAANEIISDILE